MQDCVEYSYPAKAVHLPAISSILVITENVMQIMKHQEKK